MVCVVDEEEAVRAASAMSRMKLEMAGSEQRAVFHICTRFTKYNERLSSICSITSTVLLPKRSVLGRSGRQTGTVAVMIHILM